MSAVLLSAFHPDWEPQLLERVAQRWQAGELVAFPTETVYGLGARADSDTAVRQIFAAKGRPTDHPLIVHVADAEQAAYFATHLPPAAQQLMAQFWPGPLTLIVPRRVGLAEAAAGGHSTIGLRCPAHPIAQALLRRAAQLGIPGIAAPSANRFGRISPTQAQHVMQEFADLATLPLTVVDGGACAVGIESSIVDCSRSALDGHLALLRPGMITRASIEALVGPLKAPGEDAPRAPGLLAAHYAPRAKVRLLTTSMLKTALELLVPDLSTKKSMAQRQDSGVVAVYSRTPLAHFCSSISAPKLPTQLVHRSMPQDPNQAAHELFTVLRELDEQGVALIWVEEPPTGPDWEGIRDRLGRAAAGSLN